MRINIKKSFFAEKEYVLAEHMDFKITAFKYSSGVEALKVENGRGYFIILPFQGQQIWRAVFDGHELTMKTKFSEPVPTKEYLKTYGGFLYHCGICAFGVPQSDDNHPQHGEIPNADYDEAYIELCDDYVAVGGSLYYDVSFIKSYIFSPECRLYKNDTVLKIGITLENRRNEPMDYMYLCHINFRPIDGAELIYSADYKDIKIFKSFKDTMSKDDRDKLIKYLEKLEKEPEIHHKVGGEGQTYNPEICFALYGYKADKNGRAYTLQYTDDGACYVSHSPEILPVGIRWISRTGDEDSMGMILPATAEHMGYQNAKRRGEIKYLPPLGKIYFEIEAGWLTKDAADIKKAEMNSCKNNREYILI